MKISMLLSTLVILAGCREPAHQEPAHQEPVHQEPAHPAPPPSPGAAPANAVQLEMQLLTATLERAVRAIGMGDVRSIEHDLHRLHAAKEATEAALQEGSYRPPLNPERLDRFVELDEAFHRDLGRLVATSRRNDVPGAAEAVGLILRACDGCHAEFRK